MAIRGVSVFEKFPLELFTQQVNFVNVLAAGESISSASVTAIDRSDESDATATVISGSPVVTGTSVQYDVQGGEPEQRFLISVSVTTDLGSIYEQWIEMRIPKRSL